MFFTYWSNQTLSVTVLIRAGLERMVDEADRELHDALSVVADVTEHNMVVAVG